MIFPDKYINDSDELISDMEISRFFETGILIDARNKTIDESLLNDPAILHLLSKPNFIVLNNGVLIIENSTNLILKKYSFLRHRTRACFKSAE
ncbi:MAG: hypothetical protein HQK53_06710 [Oligoflexia bacterium]|nr:hypothetical protein [Oligoflexia bacterium]